MNRLIEVIGRSRGLCHGIERLAGTEGDREDFAISHASPGEAKPWGYSAADPQEDIVYRIASAELPSRSGGHESGGAHITTEYRIVGTPVGQPAVKLLAEFIRDAARCGIPVFHTDGPAFVATKRATKLTIYGTREMAANPLPEPEAQANVRRRRKRSGETEGE
jgi:hypothetical protein